MRKKIKKFVINRIKQFVTKDILKNQYKSIFDKYKKFSMIPEKLYCENLYLAENYGSKITGDIVECGVWKGGMIAGMAEVLKNNRNYILFDSFEGLPTAQEIDGTDALKWQNNKDGENYYDNCSAEEEFAISAMQKTNTNYFVHKGWFNETLPNFKFENPIALLRLDADWYDSTMDCLKYIYPFVNKEGLIIIDDYYVWEGCSRAVHDYLSSIQSLSRISSSPEGVCYIIKKDPYVQN